MSFGSSVPASGLSKKRTSDKISVDVTPRARDERAPEAKKAAPAASNAEVREALEAAASLDGVSPDATVMVTNEGAEVTVSMVDLFMEMMVAPVREQLSDEDYNWTQWIFPRDTSTYQLKDRSQVRDVYWLKRVNNQGKEEKSLIVEVNPTHPRKRTARIVLASVPY